MYLCHEKKIAVYQSFFSLGLGCLLGLKWIFFIIIGLYEKLQYNFEV